MTEVSYRIVRFNKRELYAIEGQPNSYADIVVSGEMSARMESPSGKCVRIATQTVGKLLAPAFIFNTAKKMPVTVEALRPTTLLRMTPATLLILINNDMRIQMNFIRMLSATVTLLTHKVRLLTLYTVREKVALFLEEQTKRHNSDRFTLTTSRQEIADSFAIQKYSLQRVLSEFAKEGAIRFEGKSITVLDHSKMLSLAGL